MRQPMPAKNPRINVTLDDETTFELISNLAEKRGSSVSKMANELMLEGLALYEDKVLSEAAEEVDRATTEWVEHDEAWK